MQLGDKMTFTTVGFEGERTGQTAGQKNPVPGQVTGRIVYIHPKGRYFTVAAQVGGVTIRESFCLPGR